MLARFCPNIAGRVEALEKQVASLAGASVVNEAGRPMTDRPTRKQVDDALALIDKGDLLDRSPMAIVLAAEVRALRAERDRLQVTADEGVEIVSELRATIARVESLGSGPGYRMGDDTLVKLGEVRAALRG